MTNKEMLESMLRMQAKLDEVLLKVRGFTYRDLLRQRAYDRAILDELGELNHERKANCRLGQTNHWMGRTGIHEGYR